MVCELYLNTLKEMCRAVGESNRSPIVKKILTCQDCPQRCFPALISSLEHYVLASAASLA